MFNLPNTNTASKFERSFSLYIISITVQCVAPRKPGQKSYTSDQTLNHIRLIESPKTQTQDSTPLLTDAVYMNTQS